MRYYIIRNSTVEPFFSGDEASFSGYDDISSLDMSCDVFIWFYTLPYNPNFQKLTDEVSGYLGKIDFICNRIPKDKFIFLFTLTNLYQNNIITGDFSLRKAINNYNLDIYALAEKNSNIKIMELNDFLLDYSKDRLLDWKYYFLSKMPFNPKLANDFREWFSRQTEAVQMKRKKCLVLDLDNTLWGGILGEDGMNGIKIGGDYPGNAFLEFQKSLIAIKNSGIILSICSKNNEKDVLEIWEKNPFLLIKKEHISAYRINWNSKHENMMEIARELNIGLDSMVFIDDNPSERELIRQFLPMVEVPDFPAQPYELPRFSDMIISKYFRVYSISEEDKTKTEQYKANAERADLQKKFSDISEYLSSLEIELQVSEADQFNIPRIAQMSQKTNQFNLTTKRYTESDILNFVEKGNKVYCISVKDKFGDSGITGIIIVLLDRKKSEAVIDTLLLSCRILGKGIEGAFLNLIMGKLKSESIKTVCASYVSTLKNKQVEDFYDRSGFTVIREIKEPVYEKHYQTDISEMEFVIKPYYKIN